jgi:hypothetical protein
MPALEKRAEGEEAMLKLIRNVAAGAVLLSTPAAAQSLPNAQAQENLAYAIGVQAYVYGYPMMDLWRTFWEETLDPERGHDIGLKEFNFSRGLVTPADDWVVTPNNDTLYNRAYFDLTAEPIVLTIPPMDRRFWFPLGDMFHNLDASVSWDTVGFKGGDFALVGPGWSGALPEGVARVEVETPMIWTVGRYSVSGSDDVAAANALQDKTLLRPLSAFAGTPPPDQPASYPMLTRDDLGDPRAFFTTLNEMLRRNPPPARDTAILPYFREIGLHPDQHFDWDALPEPVRAGLTRATKDGLAIVDARTTSFADVQNGWVEAIIDADMSQAPVDHAAMARLGLLYSQKEVSTYHVGGVDADGKPLNGANTYRLHLAPVPPVDAFWSVTMHDGQTKLLVDNPIDRYSLGDRTKRTVYADADRSEIVITISHGEPRDDTAGLTGCPHRTVHFTWFCGSIHRRRRS